MVDMVPMSRLVLGPVLRHVGTQDATVWVETDSPCAVEVLGCSERTWTVAGHHYALVMRRGPAARHQHAVRGPAGRRAGLAAGGLDPPAVADPHAGRRTAAADRVRVLPLRHPGRGADDQRLRRRRPRRLRPADAGQPGAGLAGCAGDAGRPGLRRRDLRGDAATDPRAAGHHRPAPRTRWPTSRSTPGCTPSRGRDPEVRWLMSTRAELDDLRRPRRARRLEHLASPGAQDMQATVWWEERIIGGLSSYWVYQHLGNLSRASWPRTTLYQQVRGARRRRRAAAARVRRGRRPRGRRAQGRPLVLRRDLGRYGCW